MSDSVQQKLLDSEESYLNTTFCFFCFISLVRS